MFLTPLLRRLRKAGRNDEGAALAAVMGLMLVGLLVIALISSTVVSAFGYSTLTRAGVESRASAEAGIAVARASLVAGTCASDFHPDTHPSAGVYRSAPGAVPEFEATIYPRAGAGWSTTPGCPASATVDVRVIVTGEAASPAVASQSARDQETLEAVLSAPTVPTEIVANGPAVYGYNGGSFGNGGKILTADGLPIDVIFRDAGSSGTLTCDGGMRAVTNVVLANGNLRIDSGCGVSGTAWAENGTISVDGGITLGGNLRAKDVVISNGTLHGDIEGIDSVTIPGGGATISGHITTQTLTIGGASFPNGSDNAMRVYGTTTITGGSFSGVPIITRQKGTVSPWSSTDSVIITETYPAVPAVSPWEIPAAPSIPQWIDFDYDASMWAGFVEYSMGANCSADNMNAAIDFFDGRPGLIDARDCNLFFDSGSHEFEFTNDVAIFSHKMDFVGGAAIVNNSEEEHRLWLINPDTVPDGNPDGECRGNLTLDGGFKIRAQPARFNTMVYSPCNLTFGQDVGLYGQVFSNASQFNGNGTITFSPVGLPGYDLATGEKLTNSVTEEDRRVQYVRPFSE